MSTLQASENATGVPVPPELLSQVQSLYDSGMLLQAYQAAEAVCPLRSWRGTAAKILAGRMAMNLGSTGLGHIWHQLAYRDDPTDHVARYYCALALHSRRGPLRAREFMQTYGLLESADLITRCDWISRLAMIAAEFRDFDTAESLFDQALSLKSDRSWLYVERAYILEMEDRYEDALAAARQSLQINPWNRGGLQATAHALQLLDRNDEAMTLLKEAADRIESSPLAWQLAALQEDQEQYHDALATLDRFEQLSPMLDRRYTKALAARRSALYHHVGNRTQAIRLARQAGTPLLKKIADRLESGDGTGKRVVLDIPFVRQHHVTCAPATLSAISRFWSMPADHLALAEEICYDGTPAQSERNWAQTHGWIAREFTVTWDSAVALIDRGVPFTLTTTEVTTGHLQAVIGYDANRGTLLIRDPYRYQRLEFHAETTFKRYASTGPRGMTMVPAAQAHRLENLELPDATIYDLLFDLQMALKKHDRPAAASLWQTMQDRHPGHRLTLQAQSALAAYDVDPAGSLDATEKLLALFPGDARLQLVKSHHLHTLGRRDEQLQLLEKICQSVLCDPAFLQQYAELLRADARQHKRAVHFIRRALRRRPVNTYALHTLGNIKWAQMERQEALQFYHDAACADDKNEIAAKSYFIASQNLRLTEKALSDLRKRFDRLASRSSYPATTLFWAYESMNRLPEALQVLERAMELRPSDGDLALYSVDVYSRHGSSEKARALLVKAEGVSHRMSWLRCAAALAAYAGDLPRALQLWRQVLEAQPLAIDAHTNVAKLTAETQSPAAALAHLKSACERFPQHFPLARLRIQYLRDEGAQATLPVIQALAVQRPSDAWTIRELALVLNAVRQSEEALIQAEKALQLEPNNPSSHHVHAVVLSKLNRTDEAAAAWRRAIIQSVDFQVAIDSLVESCHSPEQRRQAVQFVYQELVRQVTFGDGLLAYRNLAGQSLSHEELLAQLREALAARPDLWHAWSAVIGHLVGMDRLDEALDIARQAVERFPLLPRLWWDLSLVHRMRRDTAAEIESLERALSIAPAWSAASRDLASAHVRRGDFPLARSVLQRAITLSPLEGDNYAHQAQILWKMKKRLAAIVRAKQAVLINPGLTSTWDTLRGWLTQLKRTSEAVKLARDLTVRRAGEARSWHVLASVLVETSDQAERLAACNKAIELSPRWIGAHDQLATCLCDAKRYDEALAACKPAVFGQTIPTALRGRAAWILRQSGKTYEAIEAMNALLKEDPSYYWGWSCIGAWLRDSERNTEFYEAAKSMSAHFPNDITSLNMLGGALLLIGKRDEGKAVLAKAMALAPNSEHTGSQLFEAQLADNDLPAAQQTLAVLSKHLDGNWIRQRSIALAAKRGNADAARTELFQLARSFPSASCAFFAAVGVLDKAKMPAVVDQTLLEVFYPQNSQPDAAKAPITDGLPDLAEFWMRRAADRKDWKACDRILYHFQNRPDLVLPALVPYTEALASAKQRRTFEKTLWKYHDLLRSTTRNWGSIGLGLYRLKKYDAVVKWMSDYATRTAPAQWMLMNLVGASRRLRFDAHAAAVGRFALTLPNDNTHGKHLTWLIIDEAAGKPTGQFTRQFKSVNREGWVAYHRFLAYLALAAIAVENVSPQNRARAVQQAKEELRAAEKALPRFAKTPELRRARRVILRRIAKVSGRISTHIWAFLAQ
jgi:tetratricopeptide (TPR) repeat protein